MDDEAADDQRQEVGKIPALRAQSSRSEICRDLDGRHRYRHAPDKLEAIFSRSSRPRKSARAPAWLSQAFGFAKQSDATSRSPARSERRDLHDLSAACTAPTATWQSTARQRIGNHWPRLSRACVEDNDEVGQFSMELLEDLGYAAKRVANADAALAILAEDEFAADLVFSDVIMPA